MGCFGGSEGFGCEWLIILAIIFFCCCNDGFGCFSDIFDDCGIVWLAIVLLLLFLCNSDRCGDDC
ncbi:hypothetical protein [Ruminiclostridium cellobioparum]|jgi:hypothetical protein|uniref:Uncharacterized protein n=1 Tax=Ruminiclostridium cellobioparum subsp. termitidis CT1112 TaxID=1195236 RepID=S0FH45_RUMCE|nr:hypothetical protein [Ruminiclostridium cellobioparum]EMS70970.1 hypothetical protein CTER_3224 [Ruminiclostridium cellobioparum subsp. termitidis CT1112]